MHETYRFKNLDCICSFCSKHYFSSVSCADLSWFAMALLDARFLKRERMLWLYKASDMYWNYKEKKSEDQPSTPSSSLESKRAWERAFFKWKDAMRASMSE